MRVGFLTLGCKVNSYETEKMQKKFEEAGHLVTSFDEEADAYIINTCTVTNIADRKSRKMMRRARRNHPSAVVAAVGCYAEAAAERGALDEGIDLFVPNQKKEQIVEIVTESYIQKNSLYHGEAEETCPGQKGSRTKEALAQKHTRAYIKVQSGCNQYCTYCIIPYVRGPLASRPAEEVKAEVLALAAEGVKEIVVTGIHLSSYGVDLSDQKSFLELKGKPLIALLQTLAEIQGIERIRLGSLEPRIITREFAEALATIPAVCPHFHLSLQSGCDATLKRMNRHYTAEEYLEKLEILRKYFKKPALTTDLIVGFPQETESEFGQTCQFVQKAAFAQIHVFKYSRRKGTMADAMPGQLPEKKKAERSEKLIAEAKQLENKYQEQFYGQLEHVLFEEVVCIGGKDYLTGYTERYIRVAVPVKEGEAAENRCNTIVPVRILDRLTEEILLATEL